MQFEAQESRKSESTVRNCRRMMEGASSGLSKDVMLRAIVNLGRLAVVAVVVVRS